MSREGLRIVFARVEMLHPPLPKFLGTDLHELFVEVCKRHRFETLELAGESGMSAETEDEREFQFDRERVMMSEYVLRSFDLVKENFVDILKSVNEKFDIPVYMGLQAYIRALLPMGNNDDSAFNLMRSILKIKDDQLSLLGKNDTDLIGIRLCLTPTDEEEGRHYDLQIAPYMSDPSQLQIVGTTIYHQPIETPAVFGQLVQQSYDFITNRVDKFIASL